MIFQPELIKKILAGEKTVTRRPVKFHILTRADQGKEYFPRPCRYEVGRTYALQPGRGQKGVGRIRILSVTREPSFGAVRCEWGGLRKEGFKTFAEFSAYLRRLYGEVPTGPVDRIEFELVEEEGGGG